MSADLIPESILSLSCCIAEFLPSHPTGAETDATGQRLEERAAYWNLTRSQVEAIEEWTSRAYDDERIGWPGFFRSLEAAMKFVGWLGGLPEEAVVLGLGLDPSGREEFIAEESIPGGTGDIALVASVRAGIRLPAGGRLLGWEILGLEYGGEMHSWLCSGMEVEAARRFGIRPNRHGFIEDGPLAEEMISACNREGLGEPVGYWAWAIVQYAGNLPGNGGGGVGGHRGRIL